MPERGGVRPATALALALVGYAALAICGLGLTSLFTGDDVIAAPGLGQIPGVIGMLLSVLFVFLALWTALRRPRPSYAAAFVSALGAFLGYVGGVVIGGVFSSADLGAAFGGAGSFATSWFAVVIAGAGAIAGWCAVALVRTRAERPRWPWEDDEE